MVRPIGRRRVFAPVSTLVLLVSVLVAANVVTAAATHAAPPSRDAGAVAGAGSGQAPPAPFAEPDVVSAVRDHAGMLHLFGVNTHLPDGSYNVFHAWQTPSGWTGWQPFPGYLTSISAILDQQGRLELFGTNEHLPAWTSNVYHKYQVSPGSENWSSWYTAVAGHLTNVSVVVNADGHLDLIGVNRNMPADQHNIWRAWRYGGAGWAGLFPVTGHLTSISTVLGPDGRVEVLGVNEHLPDGISNVFRSAQATPGDSTTLTKWSRLPAGYLTRLASATDAEGHLQVIGVNAHLPDGGSNIFRSTQTGPSTWSAWSRFQPGYLTSVSVAPDAADRLTVVGANAHLPNGSNNIFHTRQADGPTWSPWRILLPGHLA